VASAIMLLHYCPAILSRSSLNLLKTSVITRGRNENDLN
jgi:hypothetical protein